MLNELLGTRASLGLARVIAVGARVKRSGDAMAGDAVELVARHNMTGEKPPHGRLLGHALRGDAAVFALDDGAEVAWRVVDPLLDCSLPVEEHEPGSGGPPGARAVVVGEEGWHDPKPEATPSC